MSYSDFNLERVRKEFSLALADDRDLFTDIDPVAVGPGLAAQLDECVPVAVAVGTEKGRSELIVAPVLMEVRRRMGGDVSFFSGVEFNVDPARGLNGVCDFLLSKSRLQAIVTAPVLAVVEAKKDDIKPGLGQCASEMVAARLFNEREGQGDMNVFGAVTTGTAWRFLSLRGDALALDRQEYAIDQAPKILGILLHCVGGPP